MNKLKSQPTGPRFVDRKFLLISDLKPFCGNFTNAGKTIDDLRKVKSEISGNPAHFKEYYE